MQNNQVKTYILRDDEGVIIAVIILKNDIHNFYVKVRTAISDHFCVGSPIYVELDLLGKEFNSNINEFSFNADTIEEGVNMLRGFTLTEVVVY